MKKMRRRGSVLVETALVFPVWVMLILGIIDGGRAWFSYNLLTHAVQEGTRLASVRPALQLNDAAIAQRIQDLLQNGGLQASNVEVDFVTPLRATRTIRVRATVNFEPVAAALLWSGNAGLVIPMKAELQTQYEL